MPQYPISAQYATLTKVGFTPCRMVKVPMPQAEEKPPKPPKVSRVGVPIVEQIVAVATALDGPTLREIYRKLYDLPIESVKRETRRAVERGRLRGEGSLRRRRYYPVK